ncbi:MAG: efflux RND transporter permease subunit [Gammaproteobacteria bacterium]
MMNITDYFLKHPVIALVLNVLLLILGFLCFENLALREYPEISFPSITVSAQYPNASAAVVENEVTNALEDRLAGIEGVDTITSNSRSNSSEITLNFKPDVVLDRALMMVREAVGLAQLPVEVKQPQIERKISADGMPFMIISMESQNLDFAELTHYALLNLKNTFRSIKGVASAQVWGQPYTYHVVLDPRKMYAFGVNADDIFQALENTKLALPLGKFQNQIPVTLNTNLEKKEDYENLVIKKEEANKDPILLKQVAKLELKTDDTEFRVRINGKPGLAIAINRSNDANPLEVSKLVHEKLKELKPNLPSGLKIEIVSDQAQFVQYSIKNIQASIQEAAVLVLAIVFIFLRNIRATLIPLITIPISLIGSCIFLKLFGYSINIITLMAMVLAVGLVVDDAIVVLENIQRHIESGLKPLNAALKGAKEICFAIIAMTFTLISVYFPLAFIKGTVGQLFTEFAVSLGASVFISGIVALSLSPLMCAWTLKKNEKPLWPQLDHYLEHLTAVYRKFLSKILSHKHPKKLLLIILSLALFSIAFFAHILPSETAPKEDRSLIGVYVPLIPGKDINTMEVKLKKIQNIIKNIPEAENSLLFMGDWGGNVLLPLLPQTQRKRSAKAIVEDLQPVIDQIPSLEAYVWSWDSALPGAEEGAHNSMLSLVISTTEDYRKLYQVMDQLRSGISKENFFESVHDDLRLDSRTYKINIDQNLAAKLGLSKSQIAKTIQIFLNGDRDLTFFKEGQSYRFILKGEKYPWDLNELYLTNPKGQAISLATVASMEIDSGPERLFHHNQMRSAVLKASLLPDQKLDKAIPQLMEAVMKELPSNYKATWTGSVKNYKESQFNILILFFLALFFIFSILAIQFESFMDPLIILITVPLAGVGALGMVWIFNGSMNIYTQVGLVTLIGLISKHGILIVEFANHLVKTGMGLRAAVLEASTLRLRPILMTTAAMFFGALPLVFSKDAGYEAREAMGFVLLGGLSIGTVFTLFVLPMAYCVSHEIQEIIKAKFQ